MDRIPISSKCPLCTALSLFELAYSLIIRTHPDNINKFQALKLVRVLDVVTDFKANLILMPS